MLTMTAKQWRFECNRVLVHDERVSLVFGDDLTLGYCIMLARMLPLAKVAGDALARKTAVPKQGQNVGTTMNNEWFAEYMPSQLCH